MSLNNHESSKTLLQQNPPGHNLRVLAITAWPV